MSDIQNKYIQDSINVEKASDRIQSILHRTPIIISETLNKMLGGHEFFFKVDSLQKTGAFKIRGIMNHLLELKEQNKLPQKVVAYSTGNHGIGLAYAAQQLGIKARIYLPSSTAKVKQMAAEYYGAEVKYTKTRHEAELLSRQDGEKDYYFLHPSASNSTIAGAGTACFEALQDIKQPIDAIFCSIGGGGLASGSYLAKELLAPHAKIFGVEPSIANDAYQSFHQDKIIGLDESPQTAADGLRTLKISERSFAHIKKLDDIYLVEEKEIYYWTAWLLHLLKIACEPSCSMNMEAAATWLKTQNKPKKILILISGGNIDPSLYRELWQEEYLLCAPNLEH